MSDTTNTFYQEVKLMRSLQCRFFKYKERSILGKSKEQEKKVDQLVNEFEESKKPNLFDLLKEHEIVKVIEDDIDNYTDSICYYLKQGYTIQSTNKTEGETTFYHATFIKQL